MLPIKCTPITTPGIDLSLFRHILPQETVNQIDSKRNIQPLSKFAELVEESLSDLIDPFDHIYQTFYFELPVDPFIQMVSMKILSITSTMEGLLVKGYASGSFTTWENFLTKATKEECSQYLRLFANMVYNCLRNFPPFNNLNFQSFRDQTFGLVKRDKP